MLWFFNENGVLRGPIEEIELQAYVDAGRIGPETEMCSDENRRWRRADAIFEFEGAQEGPPLAQDAPPAQEPAQPPPLPAEPPQPPPLPDAKEIVYADLNRNVRMKGSPGFLARLLATHDAVAAVLRTAYTSDENAEAIAYVQSKLDLVRARLKSELSLSDHDFIKIPVLFEIPTRVDGDYASVGTELPNCVNATVVVNERNESFIAFPDPMFDPFISFIGDQLLQKGWDETDFGWIDTTELHLLHGEAHCGSNAVRTRRNTNR